MRAPLYKIVLPFSLGYFLSYAVRNVNAVIAPDLTDELALSATSLGLLTSAYFLAFAAFQLPLGILLDRFGSRRVQAVLLLFAASGCVLFAFASSVTGLVLARALIGVGVSGALMGAFKAYVQWFPAEKLPLVNGLTMTVGGLGALAATAPVEALLQITDWRGVLLLMAVVAVCASAVVLFFVPRHPDDANAATETFADQCAGVVRVYRSRGFWRIAPLTVTSQATFLAFQGLWAGPWFRDVAGLGREAVAAHLFYITIAMVAGFFSVGLIAERLGRRGIQHANVAIGCCVIALLALIPILASTTILPLLPWLVFGFFGGAGFLFYAVLTGEFPPALAGRVITCVNVLTFGGAFLAQWGIGVVIDMWPVSADGHFHVQGYQASFGLFATLTAFSVAWLFVAPRPPSQEQLAQ